MKSLFLAEELLLLALDDETGKLRPLPDRALDYALAGALLAELTRAERIEVQNDQVRIIDETPVGNEPVDLGFEVLKEGEVKSLQGALAHLAGDFTALREKVIQSLVEKEILKEEDNEFLWVFHWSRYPLADTQQEEAVKTRLRRLVMNRSEEISENDHLLISLVHACQLDSILFSDTELKTYRERLEAITHHDKIGRAVLECIQEIQRAILEIRTYSGL